MDDALQAAMYTLGCGLIGILLAAMEYVMYTEGVIVDEFISGSVTLPDLMAFTIIIWIIIGVVLAVSRD